MSRSLRGILIFLVVLLLVILGGTVGYFMVQNAQWVVVRFPTVQTDWSDPVPLVEYETPLPVVMAFAFGVGFLLAILIFAPSWLKRAVERRRERRFITNLEGELTDLRNMPVTHPAPLEDIDETPVRSGGRTEEQEGQGDDEDAALLSAALRGVEGEEGGR
jgi:uncharacterized membrane protein YciS (DUF1049 family)